jgi:hypothetical protein
VGSDVKVTAISCGGIAGYTEGINSRIEGCYSAATVSGRYYVGGIVGRTEGSVTNEYNIGEILRNVSQATIQPTGDNPKSYAYILGGTTSTHSKVASNYYIIDRTPINGYDTRAYHVTLDAALKNYGYDIAYRDSEHEYSCSGLKFKSGDQFLMNGEWYVAENKNFYFNPTNDLDGAVLGNVTAGGTTVEKSGGYYHFTTAEDVEVSGTMELSLPNTGDNNDLLNRFKEYSEDNPMNVTLGDRTLYRDGHWNTLYLPFRLSAEQLAADDCPLKGATIMSLTSSSFDSESNTLTLNFSNTSFIVDGVPYIVKWETTGDAIENPVFKNVTIKNTPGQITTTSVYFKGSFSSVAIDGADRTMLYLGSDDQLYYPNQAMTIGSCRAYFQLRDLTVADPAGDPIRNFLLNFNDDEVTGIATVDSNSQLSTLNSQLQGWYTLQGVKLAEKPVEQGIYLFNGKKVLIK